MPTRCCFAPKVELTDHPGGGGEIALDNGKRFPVDAGAMSVLRLFAVPRAVEEIANDPALQQGVRSFLGEFEKLLVVMPVDAPPEHEMRAVWNHLAARNLNHTMYYIDNESTTLAEFDASGREAFDAIRALVPLDPARRAVTIGCGMGRIERPLSEAVASVDAFDVSDAMLEHARAYLADHDRVRLHRTDGTLSQLQDASADLVLSFLVFQHVTREGTWRYFREAGRVLVPGGKFVFQIHTHDDRVEQGLGAVPVSLVERYYGGGKSTFTTAEVVARLDAAGFDVRHMGPGSYEGAERRLTGTAGQWQSLLIHAERR